jgi:hypothetical protein
MELKKIATFGMRQARDPIFVPHFCLHSPETIKNQSISDS